MQEKEVFVTDMVQKLRHAVTKDAPLMPRKEEFVERMGQSLQQPILRLAIMKDVPIKQRKEEYVSDMVPELRGKRCSHKGCTSYVVMGGVCVKRDEGCGKASKNRRKIYA